MNNLEPRATLASSELSSDSPAPVLGGTKIHRASILARIIHSLSLAKLQCSFGRVRQHARVQGTRHHRMGLAIHRIFRRSAHEHKFNALHRIKLQTLEAHEQQIRSSQKIVGSMLKVSKNIIFLVLKAKRREILSSAWDRIKKYSTQAYYTKRANQRRSIKTILHVLYKDKRQAFQKLATSRVIALKKQRLHDFAYLLQQLRKERLGWGLWRLRVNMLGRRRDQVEGDIKIFEAKVNNTNDPQLQALKEKKDKLQEHLDKIRQEKQQMERGFSSEHQELENQRLEFENKILSLEQTKKSLEEQIAEIKTQMSANYSMDQIYQCVYNNLLLYLHENKEQVYNKEEILEALTHPLIPLDVPIDAIKQENEVMAELLNQYVVMFGPRKLEAQVRLPYEFLVKENQAMYKMLLTLLPKVEADRDDLRLVRDSLFKLNARVKEIWGSS